MADTFLGQILTDGEWLDYARGDEASARTWQQADPCNRRVVDWTHKENILMPAKDRELARIERARAALDVAAEQERKARVRVTELALLGIALVLRRHQPTCHAVVLENSDQGDYLTFYSLIDPTTDDDLTVEIENEVCELGMWLDTLNWWGTWGAYATIQPDSHGYRHIFELDPILFAFEDLV